MYTRIGVQEYSYIKIRTVHEHMPSIFATKFGALLEKDIEKDRNGAPEFDPALYIDSIINGFPIGEILMYSSSRNLDTISRSAILDGVQRVKAVSDFQANKLRLNDDFVFFAAPSIQAGGMSYDELISTYPRLAHFFGERKFLVRTVAIDNAELLKEYVINQKIWKRKTK